MRLYLTSKRVTVGKYAYPFSPLAEIKGSIELLVNSLTVEGLIVEGAQRSKIIEWCLEM